MPVFEKGIASRRRADGRSPILYSTALLLNRKQRTHSCTIFLTWFRPSGTQNLCRIICRVVWIPAWKCVSWICRIIRSVRKCRLGSRVGCFCENVSCDLRNRLPTWIKPSSSINGLRFAILLFLDISSLVPLWGDACDVTGANPLHYGTSVTGGSS